jgi:alpha-tubulin suppressor-like RCC1 family protein
LSPPAGPLLGAAIRAQCAVERNVLRRWGVHITKQTGKDPITVTFPEDVTRLACGNAHVCVVSGGDVSCFGEGSFGELGISCAARRDACSDMPPVRVPGLPKMIDVAVAVGTSCAVSEAGEVYCWGREARLLTTDADAQAFPSPETPFRVPSLADIRRIVLTDYFACALDAHGNVWCWGRNEYGELGRGTISKHSGQPERVSSLHGVTAITANDSGACALVSDNVYCWGAGALGDHVETLCKDYLKNDWPCTPSPHRMALPTAAPIVALSPSCAIDAQGATYCWGTGRRARPSDRDAGLCGSDCVRPPRKLLGVPPFLEIADSGLHVCGLTMGHELVCWGDDVASLHVTPTEKPTCVECEGPLARIRL